MVPIDKLIDDEEATQIKKVDARTARIDQRRKQYANSAIKNADPCSVGTSDASFDINHSETAGIYGGDYDNEDDGDLSYHSSDGSDEEDSDADLISPWATARTAPLPQHSRITRPNNPPVGGR